MDGFIEIADGLWYEEATGLPWSSRRQLGGGNGWAYDGELKPLTNKQDGYYQVMINGKSFRWHRLVFEYFNGEIPKGMHIDHINTNRDDNRITNLRLVTNQQNQMNSSKRKNCSSRFKGVYWSKRDNKWRARIRINGKLKHLGSFHDELEAAKRYDEAALKYFGEFANLNFPTD